MSASDPASSAPIEQELRELDAEPIGVDDSAREHPRPCRWLGYGRSFFSEDPHGESLVKKARIRIEIEAFSDVLAEICESLSYDGSPFLIRESVSACDGEDELRKNSVHLTLVQCSPGFQLDGLDHRVASSGLPGFTFPPFTLLTVDEPYVVITRLISSACVTTTSPPR